MRKHLPNTLTIINLTCGFISILSVLRGELVWAGYFIFIAGLFDFLDGFTARLLNAYSDMGKQLDSLADVVIISMHGGAEGKDHQHVVRGDEEYLGYNRGSVYHFAHRVVDAGADVVFGHGPHVTRAVELYRDRLICYSLGNFATYRRFNLSGPNGIAPIIKVNVDGEGRFLQGEVVSIHQPGEGGPRIDPAGRALMRLKELSEYDFPDQDLVVDSDGVLWKR